MKSLNHETASLRTVAATRLKLVEFRLEKMEQQVTEKKEEAVDLSIHSHKYLNALKEHEQVRDLYFAMKDQQHRARIQLRMPRHPVTIHSFPE